MGVGEADALVLRDERVRLLGVPFRAAHPVRGRAPAPRARHTSSFAPESSTSLRQYGISRWIFAASASGLSEGSAEKPEARSFSRIPASSPALRTAALRRAATSGSKPAGPTSASQALMSTP